MIYLFEDRIDRMNLFLDGKKDLDKNLINYSTKIDCSKNELNNFFSNLNEFDGIIIHKTYSYTDKNITIKDIEDMVQGTMKKFIIKFSGQSNNAVIKEYSDIELNSGTFYNNLELFLDSYKNNKVVLPLLVFGKNGYIKNQLKQYQIESISELLTSKDDIYMTIYTIKEHLDTYIKSDDLQNRKQKLENWFQDLIDKRKNITKETLIDQINKFSSYENN